MKSIMKGIRYIHSLCKDTFRVLKVQCILYTLAMGVLPYLYVVYLENMTAVLAENRNRTQYVKELIIFTIVLTLLNALAIYTRSKSDNKMTRLRMEVVAEVNRKVMEMPYGHVEDEAFQRKYYRVFHALDSSETGFEKVCHLLFLFPSQMMGYVMLMGIFVRHHMGIWTVVALGLLMVVQIYESIRMTRYKMTRESESVTLERQLEDLFEKSSAYACGKEIRLNGMQRVFNAKIKQLIKAFKDLTDSVIHHQWRLMIPRILVLMSVFVAFFSTLMHQIKAGNLAISSVAMLIAALYQILLINQKISADFQALYFESDAVSLLSVFMEKKNTADESHPTHDSLPLLEVQNLSYRYKNSSQWVLKDVSFKVYAGDNLAIVGLNGAGKSTLIKCISGLYDDYTGSIKWCGKEIKESSTEWIASQMKVLFQDVNAYPFSIRENIVGMRECESESEVIHQYLEMMGLAEKIKQLPMGLETHVTTIFSDEGVQFSGGEEQRLEFSRILYHNPNLVILDEPTSALDSFSEKRLFHQIDAVLKDKTCLFITHRLHNVQNVQQIAVMQEGTIVESGNHGTLMALEGVYHTLFNLQKNYYEDIKDDTIIEKTI